MLNSLTLLRAMNGIYEEDVVMAGNSYFDEKQVKHLKTKRIISFALAAALILSLGIAAYAAFSSMTHRVPKKSETFRINWEENPSGYIEWSDAKLAVTFPETAESKEIEFRPGWLPDEMASLKDGSWCGRLTAEKLAFSGSPQTKIPAYQDMMQPLLIETYYMSQFTGGGALLLQRRCFAELMCRTGQDTRHAQQEQRRRQCRECHTEPIQSQSTADTAADMGCIGRFFPTFKLQHGIPPFFFSLVWYHFPKLFLNSSNVEWTSASSAPSPCS